MRVSMRVVLGLALAAAMFGTAQAERRMFIVSSNPDGYGIDRCLEAGAKCGAAMAAAYCKTQQFVEAASFRKVERDEITGSIPDGNDGRCRGAKCDEFVAIVCSR
jgi:hypothetical protein